jgi:beta-lactamase superfamily II metal-dependent hydrolase
MDAAPIHALTTSPVMRYPVFEFDFLAVGDGERSGDAIALRYSHPATGVPVLGIVDAGFDDDGDALVEHVIEYYGTDAVDFFLSTHPDADHLNGAGKVIRGLRVGTLMIHRPAQHGFPNNSGAEPAEELVTLAVDRGATVIEPFAGVHGFGGSLQIAGPTPAYYEAMLEAQEETAKASARSRSLAERFYGSAVATVRQVLDAFPGEIFFDDAGGTNPRNNSSAILSLVIDGEHFLLPGDAGVPAFTQALDALNASGRTNYPLNMIALPHHGSRHNLDRATIERLLGAPPASRRGIAVASVSEESSNPSPRVANACGRRGYPVFTTGGSGLHHSRGIAPRAGWLPKSPLPPLVEDDHDD